MGQPLWNPPGGAPPQQQQPAPTGVPDLKCYQCGNQGFRQMTSQMAALVPGGCVEVDASKCAAPPPAAGGGGTPSPWPVQQPGGGTGGGVPNPNQAGVMDINLTVFRADDLKGFSGAKVTVGLITYNSTSGLAQGGIQEVGSGTTDQQGKFFYHADAPAPAQWHGFRITVSPGTGPSFPAKSLDVQGWLPNGVTKTDQVVAVCPSGIEDLVCEVGEKQLYFSQVYNQQLVAWHYEESGRPAKIAAYAIKTAHFFLESSSGPVRNPLLAKYWSDLSWAITDLGIPPTDWPDLVKWYDQTMTIFEAIPWPSTDKVRALFKRCAVGLPLYNGEGINAFRLYSKTYSDYFPREDYKIRADMAASYLLNVGLIFECMIQKEINAAKKMQKHLHNLAGIRLAAAIIFAPLTGAAAPGLLITEAGQAALSIWGHQGQGDVQGIIAGLGKNVSGGVAAVGAGLFAAGVAMFLPQIVKGADPAVQKVVEMFGPQVAEAAAKDVIEAVIPNGTIEGAGLLSAQGLGTAGAALAVEAMLSLITLKGVKDAKAFAKDVAKVGDFIAGCATPDEEGQICGEMVPFVLWCIQAMFLDKFFDHVADQAGIPDVNMNSQVIKPAAQTLEGDGVQVPPQTTAPGGVVGGPSAGTIAAVASGGIGAALLVAFVAGAFR